ncbi:MAG TPA: class I SAM-dependent methyltransferase [Streptosporangiaceae bacterium]
MGHPSPPGTGRAVRRNPVSAVGEMAMAVSMTGGRGAVARAIVDEARLAPGDRAVDIGCGPGTAARIAAARGVPVTGVDPSSIALRLARVLGRGARAARITWMPGTAEHLPLADGAVTVAWSISSVHHWADQAAGCAEMHRVLAPGGRVLLAERLVSDGATGFAAHGSTVGQAEQLCRTLGAAGFTDVSSRTMRAGRRMRIVISATRPSA